MYCPACVRTLKLDRVEDHDTYAYVFRVCDVCNRTWRLKIVGRVLVETVEQTSEMEEVLERLRSQKVAELKFGFDYVCPSCGHQCYVGTVYRPEHGWSCIACGAPIPKENLYPRNDYVVPDGVRVPTTAGGSSRRRKNQLAGYTRAPRTSRPVPAGAIGLKELAERINVEPKKLRSWLRKVNWRKAEEAGSGWYFSKEEADEVAKNFGK